LRALRPRSRGSTSETLEIAIRFLTDYLESDVYFNIKRENHNLERCRTQLALVQSIEEQEEAMQRFVDSL